MNRRGVIYDVGTVFSGYGWRFSTRPGFDPAVTRRELEIIRADLHCNAVRIGGTDLARVLTAAEDALVEGLEVWLSPALFEQSQQQTIDGLVRAATAAESLRRRYPGRLVFVAGTEATLFTRGIVPGNSITKRFTDPANREAMKAGKHNAPLNDYLARACRAVRAVSVASSATPRAPLRGGLGPVRHHRHRPLPGRTGQGQLHAAARAAVAPGQARRRHRVRHAHLPGRGQLRRAGVRRGGQHLAAAGE
jgi:hypothetical protein